MSVVIVGGNDCMVRKYMDVCESYKCSAKVFTQMKSGLKNKIGCPDLLILFTNTMSHKMMQCTMKETKGLDMVVARSHSSSISALKNILDTHVR